MRVTSKTILLVYCILLTARNQCRKFETNITGKGIARPQSQFPHSCVCKRFIYPHNRSAYSSAGNMWTDPGNIYIAHRYMIVVIVEIGTEAAQFPEQESLNEIFIAVLLPPLCFSINCPLERVALDLSHPPPPHPNPPPSLSVTLPACGVGAWQPIPLTLTPPPPKH